MEFLAGYQFRSAPGRDAALNFTATAEPVQIGQDRNNMVFSRRNATCEMQSASSRDGKVSSVPVAVLVKFSD